MQPEGITIVASHLERVLTLPGSTKCLSENINDRGGLIDTVRYNILLSLLNQTDAENMNVWCFLTGLRDDSPGLVGSTKLPRFDIRCCLVLPVGLRNRRFLSPARKHQELSTIFEDCVSQILLFCDCDGVS
eukprot:gene20698-biopygen6890